MNTRLNQPPLIKIKVGFADEVCVNFDLAKEARALLRDEMPPREFLEALLKNKQYQVGIDFLAHALPAREAIWWGCLCLQYACGNALTAAERTASTAVVQWVLRPTDDNRTAARGPTGAGESGLLASALVSAATQTGETPVASDRTLKLLATEASAKNVAGAVKLAAAKRSPAGIADTQRLFVELGIGVAEARFGWPELGNHIPFRS